jgi:hypothetical protein
MYSANEKVCWLFNQPWSAWPLWAAGLTCNMAISFKTAHHCIDKRSVRLSLRKMGETP